jgi:hypothetical protein
VFRGDKKQSVLGDARDGGYVGMADTLLIRYTLGTAMDQLQVQTDKTLRNNGHQRRFDQRVCLEVKASARIHTRVEAESAAVGDYNGPREVVEAEEQRTEALASASLDDNTKSLEKYHCDGNGRTRLILVAYRHEVWEGRNR